MDMPEGHMPPSDSYFPPDISQPEPDDLPERRQGHVAWRALVDRRLAEHSVGLQSMRDDLHATSAAVVEARSAASDARIAASEAKESIASIKADTGEVIGLLQSFQGAMRVLELFGKLAKPLAYIVMLGSALWGAFSLIKGGGGPPR